MEKTIPFTARIALCLLLVCNMQAYGQGRDIAWLRAVHVNRSTSLDGTMNGISASVYPVAFAIPAGSLLYGYIARDKQFIHNGWQTIAAIGTSTIIAYGLKYAVDRKRPYETYMDIIPPYEYTTTPAFPSGHTSLAFTAATSVSLQYRRWYVVVPAYTLAALTGYSRMHLGMHYPSDVVAGALVGAGSAFLAYKGQQWLMKRKHNTTVKPVE